MLICRDNTVKYLCPLTADRRNEARERTPCVDPSLVPFHDLIWQIPSCVMKVDRFDADVRVKGVLVEESRTARKSGSREIVHEEYRVRAERFQAHEEKRNGNVQTLLYLPQ